MAQFVEVMNQARRICLEHSGDCDGCSLHDDDRLVCRFDLGEKYLYYDTAERIVLKWAAEHPKPVYPSWVDAWQQLFPGAKNVPCPELYFGAGCQDKSGGGCIVCKRSPIPDEIAEKLWIKPKEELSDAKIH